MATLRVAPKPEVATMKAAQISKPGADFEIVEREIPEPDAGQVRIKVKACGICHSDVLVKEGLLPGFSIHVFPGTKSRASLMKLARASLRGRRASVWESAGTVGTTAPAANAAAETFAIAATARSPASATTADISNTWWLPWKRWCRSRTA